MFKRIITVILCMSILFSFCCIANATGSSIVMPRYDYCTSTSVSLEVSNNTAYCQSIADAYPYYTERVIIEMHLEKKTLWWWDDVTSWTVNFKGGYSALDKEYTVSGGTYRVRTIFTIIAIGGDTETITEYSNEVSA